LQPEFPDCPQSPPDCPQSPGAQAKARVFKSRVHVLARIDVMHNAGGNAGVT